jgi:hypothetical protein
MEENSNMFLACQKFNFATKIWWHFVTFRDTKFCEIISRNFAKFATEKFHRPP